MPSQTWCWGYMFWQLANGIGGKLGAC